jgi:type II secretory pathway pseudopilin PulG
MRRPSCHPEVDWNKPSDVVGTRSTRGQGGGTLVELLAVVAILALLAGVAVLWARSGPAKADAATCSAELETVRAAVHAANSTHHAPLEAATPGDYLEGSTRFFTWSGDPGGWAVDATGPIPFDC